MLCYVIVSDGSGRGPRVDAGASDARAAPAAGRHGHRHVVDRLDDALPEAPTAGPPQSVVLSFFAMFPTPRVPLHTLLRMHTHTVLYTSTSTSL